MTRGRKPKSLSWLEGMAGAMWHTSSDARPDTAKILWADREARLFGMGEAFRGIGQHQASEAAFFLASLAGHLARGDLPLPVQSEIFKVYG